jgi:hypothetical protein
MKFTTALGLVSGAMALPPRAPKHHAIAPHKVSLSRGRGLTHPGAIANIPEIIASLGATRAKLQHNKPLPQDRDEHMRTHQAGQDAGTRRWEVEGPGSVPLADQYLSMGIFSTDKAYYGPVTVGSGDGNAQTFQLCVLRPSCPGTWAAL